MKTDEDIMITSMVNSSNISSPLTNESISLHLQQISNDSLKCGFININTMNPHFSNNHKNQQNSNFTKDSIYPCNKTEIFLQMPLKHNENNLKKYYKINETTDATILFNTH